MNNIIYLEMISTIYFLIISKDFFLIYSIYKIPISFFKIINKFIFKIRGEKKKWEIVLQHRKKNSRVLTLIYNKWQTTMITTSFSR